MVVRPFPGGIFIRFSIFYLEKGEGTVRATDLIMGYGYISSISLTTLISFVPKGFLFLPWELYISNFVSYGSR